MRKLFVIMAAMTVVALSTTVAHATTQKIVVGHSNDYHLMTSTEAASYLASLQTALAPISAHKCGVAHRNVYLHAIGSSSHLADVDNYTSWCWFPNTGHIMSGTVRVNPSEHHDFGFDSSERWWNLGWPWPYIYRRRNSCAHAKISLVATAGYNSWSLTAAVQVRGDGTHYYNTVCYGNIGSGSF